MFGPSGLDGAGFQNVVAYSPFKDSAGLRPVLMGADIAGIHRSVDGGKNWLVSNVGLPGKKVSALMFSDVTPGRVYVATDSAIAVSTDFGLTWAAKAAAADFDGNGTYQVVSGQGHPRATGNLFAQDNSGSTHYFYAATASGGVKRSTDDATRWDTVALAGHHLRSIALNPSNPNQLYVADAHVGLQVSNDAKGAMGFSVVPGSPAIPEELLFLDGKLYVAAHTSGIFMYDGAWHALNTGLALTSAWESITGYVENGQVVLVAGCAYPSQGMSTMRSMDGGASWASIFTGPGATVSPTEYGQTLRWWAADVAYLDFTGSAFVNAMTAIDPDDHNSLLVAGRGGAKHGQISASGVAWAPSVRGLMVTVNMMVTADPKIAGRVYIGNMDFTFLASGDDATTVQRTVPSGSFSTGDVIALDPDGAVGAPSTVYLAASTRGQNTGAGGIWSNPDPLGQPARWTDESIPVLNDVLAVGVGHDSQSRRVLLASITNSGLYRKVADAWGQVTGTAPFASGDCGKILFVPGTSTVFAMDGVGVWRSPAAGASGSWVKLASASAGYDNVDSLALDPVDLSTLYFSDSKAGGVVRISGAAGASPTLTLLLSLSSPGPLAVTRSGALLVQDRRGGRLMRSASPRSGTPTFTSVGDTFFSENNGNIRSLAVGANEVVFTASNSAGVSVGILQERGP